jgi:hypothetical protein
MHSSMLFLCILDISDTYADLDSANDKKSIDEYCFTPSWPSLIGIKFSENPYKPVKGGYVNFQSHIELFLTCIWTSHGTFKFFSGQSL